MKPVIAALALLLTISTAQAAPTVMPRTCVIANQSCFILRTRVANLSPSRRMGIVNDRLASILGLEICRANSVHALAYGNDVAIYVGHSLLVTVTAADAKAAGCKTTGALAGQWMAELRKALPAGHCR